MIAVSQHAKDNSENFHLKIIHAHLTDMNCVKYFADEIFDNFDEEEPLDCLINNAGIIDN